MFASPTPGGRAIPTPRTKSRTSRPRGAGTGRRRPTAAAPRSPPKLKKRPKPKKRLAEQPLGAGVGDAHAVRRLKVPPPPVGRVRELGWAEFADVAKALAERIAAKFRPDVVLGIVNGGMFVGGVIAPLLRAELQPVRVQKKGRRRVAPEKLSGVRGRSVLVVDDVTVSGATMGAACAAARRGGAKAIRTATLVVRPGGARPDFRAIEATELVVFGWDYGLDPGGAAGGDPGEVGV